MILYCDTSALVKKYIKEEGSRDVIKQIDLADSVVLSVIGYSEIFSAFCRKKRTREISEHHYQKASEAFGDDWKAFVKVNVTDELNKLVKWLLSKYSLGGFDAIHLASAILMKRKLKQDIFFLSYDQRQKDAAQSEHLTADA